MATATKNGTKPKRLVNFNEFRKEYQKTLEPIVVQIGEDEVELPAQIPATVMLDLMAFMEEQGPDGDLSDMPVDVAMKMMSVLIGEAKFQSIIRSNNLDLMELMWLVQTLLGEYMRSQPETELGKLTTANDSTS